ncbi:uncharacterized protein [Dermacentor albipictus]|uniref:uncharacterized protein n=1 Tax=Dermacentor albipictus TaxID=60249 RepID=UPI0031FCC994
MNLVWLAVLRTAENTARIARPSLSAPAAWKQSAAIARISSWEHTAPGVSRASHIHTFTADMNWSAKLQRLLENFDIMRISFYHEKCKLFFVGDQHMGFIRPNDWIHLAPYKDAFQYDIKTNRVFLNPSWKTYEERSAKAADVLQDLRKKKIFKTLNGWRNECYEVSARFGDKPGMKMERSATCLFGLKRYGVHINGYVKRPDGSMSVWFQRRSATKETFPNKIDNMVTGGFCVGYTLTECVRKEAQEEASLPDHLLSAIRPAGNVSFVYEDDRGIFPETIFVFDLELPADFEPHCSDNEVDNFYLMAIPEVKNLVLSEEFKITSCPILLDFLVRHHFLSPDDEPNYCQLMDTVHMPLHNFYPSAMVPTDETKHRFHNNSSAI